MDSLNCINRFRINHVGYLPSAPKVFTYDGNASEFKVMKFQDLLFDEVYKGELIDTGFGYKTGDFSEFDEEGIYRLETNEGNSRCFVIWNDAYDTVERMLSEYFVWQKCSDEEGWNGACHMEDKIALKSGEIRSLLGGFHQSSDLRKWVFGTSLGLSAFIEYALTEKRGYMLDKAEDIIRHGMKYYLELITDEGYLIDCTWVPHGYDESLRGKGYGDYRFSWNARQYFESPNNEPSHWETIICLSLASVFMKDRDSKLSEEYLKGAKKIWSYMQGKGQEMDMRKYDLPLYPPLGHDGMIKMYQGYFKGSALRYAAQAKAAMAIFRATDDENYKAVVEDSLNELGKLRVGGDVNSNHASACYWESADTDILANNYYYFYPTQIPMAFANAAELWPDDRFADEWKINIKSIADQYVAASSENAFGRLPGTWFAEGKDVFEVPGLFSFSEKSERVDKIPGGCAEHNGNRYDVFYKHYSFCYNLEIISGGVFLAKAAEILETEKYLEISQKQYDWILGANMKDSSNVEGVGYNHPHRGIFGEFFPPVPQIPGGVYTGITENSYEEASYGLDNEYDMPMVGWMLHLTELIKKVNK